MTLEIKKKYLLIVERLSYGLTSREIAEELGQSERTIETNIGILIKMLNCNNRVHLISTCIREKIIE